MTAHDGFTLNDIVSYNERHNEANGENNQDGSSNNRSWNCGAEGPTDDPAILALRQRQMRNILATLLISQGTPMLLAGDEFARTQRGNNNAYCQDNEIGWVDWNALEKNAGLMRFVQELTALRQKYPILRRNLFLNGQYNEDLGVRDVTWINRSGEQMSEADWNDDHLRCFGMLLDGRAPTSGVRKHGSAATMLLVFNGHAEPVDFHMPSCTGACSWKLIIDTNLACINDGARFAIGAPYVVTGRSLLAFVLEVG